MTLTTQFAEQLARSSKKSTSYSTMRQRKTEKDKKQTDIQSNPFYEIVSTTSDPVVQKQKMTELMVHTDAETTTKNAEALNQYTAWMQQQRQDMATKLIEMTDTETFQNMQAVLQDINDGVLDFEEQIEPFMEIIKAVRQIQEADATTDIIAELREEETKKKERTEEINRLHGVLKALLKDEQDLLISIQELSKQKAWFGFGDIKEDAKSKIASIEVSVSDINEQITKCRAKIDELKNIKPNTTKFKELEKAKEILADMLNLSSEEHGTRHQQLIDTASNFVKTTQERVKDTLNHSLKMDDQINRLSDLSFNMQNQYTVLVEATRDAEKINSDKHVTLQKSYEELDEEDYLTRMDNEKHQRDISKHIKLLNDAKTDSVEVLNDLTVSGKRISNMADANSSQIKKTRAISTTGIAGVADNLSTVLTSINQAALGQAAIAAQQSLRRMNNNTVELSKEQMLNMVKERNDDNAALVRSLESLAGFGEVIQLANESTYEALQENRELVDSLKQAADEVQQTVRDGMKIQSEIITEDLSQ